MAGLSKARPTSPPTVPAAANWHQRRFLGANLGFPLLRPTNTSTRKGRGKASPRGNPAAASPLFRNDARTQRRKTGNQSSPRKNAYKQFYRLFRGDPSSEPPEHGYKRERISKADPPPPPTHKNPGGGGGTSPPRRPRNGKGNTGAKPQRANRKNPRGVR